MCFSFYDVLQRHVVIFCPFISRQILLQAVLNFYFVYYAHKNFWLLFYIEIRTIHRQIAVISHISLTWVREITDRNVYLWLQIITVSRRFKFLFWILVSYRGPLMTYMLSQDITMLGKSTPDVKHTHYHNQQSAWKGLFFPPLLLSALVYQPDVWQKSVRMTHFHTSIGIYQFGHEWTL